MQDCSSSAQMDGLSWTQAVLLGAALVMGIPLDPSTMAGSFLYGQNLNCSGGLHYRTFLFQIIFLTESGWNPGVLIENFYFQSHFATSLRQCWKDWKYCIRWTPFSSHIPIDLGSKCNISTRPKHLVQMSALQNNIKRNIYFLFKSMFWATAWQLSIVSLLRVGHADIICFIFRRVKSDDNQETVTMKTTFCEALLVPKPSGEYILPIAPLLTALFIFFGFFPVSQSGFKLSSLANPWLLCLHQLCHKPLCYVYLSSK